MARRRPRRITFTIPPHLAAALDALAVLEGRPPNRVVRGLVYTTLAEAQRDPLVQAALRDSRRGRLYRVGVRPSEPAP
jgi:hypothetical protein